MPNTPFELAPDSHHNLAISLFNSCWSLLEKDELSDKERSQLEHMALGSLYHWHRSPKYTPLNDQRGGWMVSRVYAVLGEGDKALVFAEACWQRTEELSLGDFDRSYALEALARAHAAAGHIGEAQDWYAKAETSAEGIEGPKDRDLFLSDLKTGPWFGLQP